MKMTTDQVCRGGLPNEEEGKNIACIIEKSNE